MGHTWSMGHCCSMGHCWSMGPCWSKVHWDYWQRLRKRSAINDTKQADLGGGNVRLVTTMEKWEKETSEANSNGKTVVVNFSATWCGPCRQIAPAYCELADKYSSYILFLTVDVDKLVEFSTSWDIQATPTFFFMRDGRQVDKVVGANEAELQKKIAMICEST